MILYGRNPVAEALRGRRARSIERVWATQRAAREPWLRSARARGIAVEIISAPELVHDLEASVDERLLTRPVQLEIAAGRDRVEDWAIQGILLERPDGAAGEHRRRLATAEAERVSIERVEAARDGLLARKCDRREDRRQRCPFFQGKDR